MYAISCTLQVCNTFWCSTCHRKVKNVCSTLYTRGLWNNMSFEQCLCQALFLISTTPLTVAALFYNFGALIKERVWNWVTHNTHNVLKQTETNKLMIINCASCRWYIYSHIGMLVIACHRRARHAITLLNIKLIHKVVKPQCGITVICRNANKMRSDEK